MDKRHFLKRSCIILYCVASFIAATCAGQAAHAQNRKLYNALETYFPVLPFDLTIDSLVKFYQLDTTFIIDTVETNEKGLVNLLIGHYDAFPRLPYPGKSYQIILNAKRSGALFYTARAELEEGEGGKKWAIDRLDRLYGEIGSYCTKYIPVTSRKKEKNQWISHNYYINRQTSPFIVASYYEAPGGAHHYFALRMALTLTD